MDNYHNLSQKRDDRRTLRNTLTLAEATLWKSLKGGQLSGRKFRRQHSIGAYILDFYCPEERIAVELDGAGHYTTSGNLHDTARTAYLNTLSIYTEYSGNPVRKQTDLVRLGQRITLHYK